MKQGIIVFLALMFLMSSVALAEQDTSNGDWRYINSSYVDHTHKYSRFEPLTELGLGVDITLYEFPKKYSAWGLLQSIEAQNKYDLANTEYSGYIVVQLNAWKPIKKLLGL